MKVYRSHSGGFKLEIRGNQQCFAAFSWGSGSMRAKIYGSGYYSLGSGTFLPFCAQGPGLSTAPDTCP